MIKHYILNENGEPQREENFDIWARWMETHPPRLANDVFIAKNLEVIQVSTMFLGADHRVPYQLGRKPILWETMIFGGRHDLRCWRYVSLTNARAGHALAIALVKKETRWQSAKG